MRVFRIVLLALGVVILVVAAIWRPVVAPALTKLPTSLDTTVSLAGTYTGYVNQSTGAPLAAPQQVPLSISRQIKAIPAKSTSSVLIVHDASAVSIGPSKSSAVLQYAVDRSSELNVRSPNAYALTPGNVVNRSGGYTLGPPMGTDTSKSYPLWIDEIGRNVPLTSQPGTVSVGGVSLQRWGYTLKPTPMIPAMVKAMKLPPAMPFAAFQAELKAKGMDLGAAFQALAPSLTSAQRASLAALTSAPIPLQYLYASHASLLVQPDTGATGEIGNTARAYSVRPNLGHLAATLTPILAAHASNPVAAKLIAAAKGLANPPAQPLYTLTFHQTPASAVSTSQTAGNSATLLGLVQVWIPVILGVIGLILVGLALFLMRRSRTRGGSGSPDRTEAGAREAMT